MSGARHCGCTICSVEKSLEEHLGTRPAQEAYATLLAAFPSLAGFPTASSLLDHLRNMRFVHGSGEASDNIFRTLRESLGKDNGISKVLLLLAVVPLLHATVTSLARAWPSLDREDLAQQAVAIFIELLHSQDLRRHETHLAFSLARELRRAVSLWVQDEARLLPQSPNSSTPERSISAADLFEREVQLRHFLARSLRTGALDEDDLHLLIDFKLEAGIEERRNGPASNAVRQRMKRLLSKMRRHARPRRR
jgi:hypothetical protein